ncbi:MULTISPECIES: 30S ribosomal protein S20 [Malaciobacter]|jgi:small subunit ribosomal protein S20|uniref:Small ribosomal subunit protein bS20 n=2 Tax=Malaciobacter TaxID=2321114 RepID=A0AB36ZUH0_9BACT|nr:MULTISPECIES: 30S ribosomal protein S20 [Malaciobacter]PHO09136.1 30S ribosomal protein S20 [Malaciobacter canalis]PPK60417.1 small subunit ribosomal protein S20 [Malaciobacter marinus]QEE31759.1 30S ribosomal protein S20 [Malaciobacter canalis]SKB56515.1 SSU ribosomal protein S20P [Malaciobacter marinus]
MANHKSAEKRARQTKVRTERNRFYKTRVKNITKDVLSAVEANDKEKATEAMKTANKYIHHCVSKGILKKGNAARKVSRLQTKVNAI